MGRLAEARVEGRCWTIKGDRFKYSGAERKTKIYSRAEQAISGRVEKAALSTLPDFCMYLKSLPVKFIMNLIQSSMAQRNVLSNKKVLLRDR